MEQLPRLYLTRDEMLKRVARFKDLKGSDGGLPDSGMPGCERMLFNVIGFQPPKGEGGAVTSPVGDDASRLAAMAKRLATDAGFEAVNGCLQLHGGYGYLRDHPIERVLRDVRVHQILEGTNEVMRLIVSRDMLGN